MNDYADIYFVDERNATIDRRTGQVIGPNGRPMSRSMTGPYPHSPMMGPHGYNPAYGQHGPGYPGAQHPGPQYPGGYPHPYPPYPGYAASMGPLGSTGLGSSLLGRISTGDLIDLIAQVFAALNPLPAAPVGTADAATDIDNLILYQGSLASYAKKDEQVRTLGHLVGKLIG